MFACSEPPETLTYSQRLMQAYSSAVCLTAFIAIVWGVVLIGIGFYNDVVTIIGEACIQTCWYCQASMVFGAISITAGLLVWPWSIFLAQRPAYEKGLHVI